MFYLISFLNLIKQLTKILTISNIIFKIRIKILREEESQSFNSSWQTHNKILKNFFLKKIVSITLAIFSILKSCCNVHLALLRIVVVKNKVFIINN